MDTNLDVKADTDAQAADSKHHNRTTLVTFLVLLLGIVAITFKMLLPYLLSVLMGAILALLAYPIYRKLIFRKMKPTYASLLVTIGILVLVIAPIAVFATIAIKQGIALGHWVTENEFLSFESIRDRLSGFGPAEELLGDPRTLETRFRGWVQSAGKTVTTAVLGIAANLPSLILQLALASLACFFFLVDGPKFIRWMIARIPLDADVRTKLINSFKDTAISVIWATLAAALVQGVIMMVAFLVLGVPAAVLALGATFIFAWIPILGSTPVWLGGALYLYLQGSVSKVVIMVVFGAITGIADNFVRPMVLKGRGNMHPLVSLIAIFGGIEMFGILGVFIGPILTAVAISLLQIWPAVGHRFGIVPRQ